MSQHTPAPSVENERLAALYLISRTLDSSLNLDDTLSVAVMSAIRLTGAERGFLMLFNEADELVFRIARNAAGVELEERKFEISRTVVRQIAQTGTPIVTTNAALDPRFSATASVVKYSLRSILAVPLTARGKVTGVLYVDNKVRVTLFGQSDLDLLTAFADQAALAIENARLYTQTDLALTARVAELQTMQAIDRDLNAELDLGNVLAVTLEWAVRRTGAARGWTGLVSGGEPIRAVAGHGVPAEALFSPGDARLWAALTGLEAAAFPAGPSEPAALVAPVVREGRAVAVIVLERTDQAFGPDALQFLSRLADHAAISIENARLYAAVQQANEAKSEFVRTVSHELKTPMTAIMGYTDLMKMVGPLTPQQAKYVGSIRASVDRMAVLVSDLADISAIESGRFNVELAACELQPIVREAVGGLHAQLDARQQSVRAQFPPDLPRVHADPDRLVQVLSNLLSNAHKYSPAGSEIVVTAAVDDDRVSVSVSDHGYGIAPEDVAQLFTQFFRSDEPTVREQPGWGLGLHITRRLVELLGGQISVRSAVGQGSTFTFDLPVAGEA